MLSAILEGLSYGLLLSVLTGPIFFTILQVSIERGHKAGTALVAGQWLSDFIYIGLAFWGAGYMQALDKDVAFKAELTFYLGTLGCIFLAILGLLLLLSKPKAESGNLKLKNSTLLGFFGQGFLINTLTPFPIFFWISLMSAGLGRGLELSASIGLFVSVMSMVIITDMLKVYAAKYIRRLLSDKAILLVRKIAGLALILSALILSIRIFYWN